MDYLHEIDALIKKYRAKYEYALNKRDFEEADTYAEHINELFRIKEDLLIILDQIREFKQIEEEKSNEVI